MTDPAATIVSYRPEFAAAFDRLNRAWLERYITVEPQDEAYLGDPEGKIIAPGGEVFFAVSNGTVLGTCAAIPRGENQFELAKLCVTPEAQGRGLGRALAKAVIAFAERKDANRVMLVSNSRLEPAIKLYETLGFQHRPFPGARPYIAADVYMELDLSRPVATRE